CACAESRKVINLKENPYRPILCRPTFRHRGYQQQDNPFFTQLAFCYHSSEKDDDDHISPFLSFTDGNTTIENIRTDVKGYTFSSKSATVTFNALDKFFINKYGYDLNFRDVFIIYIIKVKSGCECPSMPSNDAMEYQWAFQVHYRSNLIQFLQLNVDSECEYIDCHFTPPRISNDYTYDNCGNDFLIVRKTNKEYKEAKIGRNEIHVPHNAPLLFWLVIINDPSPNDFAAHMFHRNGRCENSTNATVSMKHSSCECPLQEIYRGTNAVVEIYSPGYSEKFSYCSEMNCTVIFNAPDYLHYVFFIREMDIADDSIDIYFGSSTLDKKKTLTGRGSDIEVNTKSSHAIFNFISDDDVQGRGYYVKVTTVSKFLWKRRELDGGKSSFCSLFSW
uniref:CUB domain-containing protein n=1 Tax=Pristionchus pacificus TaxID=54126 RepID=A0A8R1YI61_PRIPA